MLKTVVLPNIFVETVMHFIFQDPLSRKIFYNIIVFTGTFYQFNFYKKKSYLLILTCIEWCTKKLLIHRQGWNFQCNTKVTTDLFIDW